MRHNAADGAPNQDNNNFDEEGNNLPPTPEATPPSASPDLSVEPEPELQNQLRPRLTIDRPVWTVSECYQLGSQDLNSIPGLYNDLNNEETGGAESVSTGTSIKNAKNQAKAKLRKHFYKAKTNYCSKEKFLRAFISLFPCIGWLRTYKIKEYLVCDIISGITSAIFHVPQGMANALANAVMPVYGLYGSFFPSAVYSVMGTSMQTSVGTFTVVSLLTANAVRRLATVESGDSIRPGSEIIANETLFLEEHNSTISGLPAARVITPIEVTVAVTLVSGIVQVLLGLLRMGRLGILISPSLASGFMTGCAVQIIASQLKGCFNLAFKDFTGIFNVINTFIAVFTNLPNANLITSMMSLSVCIVLIIGKDLLNPKFQKFFRIPLPVDLIMVIICSIISYYLDLKDKYHVPIVNYIPKGLPSPVAPSADLMMKVIGDAVAVGLVGFAATFSMGTTFARRYNHKVDANQELLALGCANIFGGFFLCLPGCGSLARSSVLESVGCKTQLTGMISCVFLALVLYFIGPLLEPLPKCVLATILATALKGYLSRILEVRKLWAISKADAIVWITTCLSVIILDVTYGLIVGVIFTLLSVTWRMQSYRGILLREVETSGIFLPNSKKKKVLLAPDHGKLILFRFGNPLCFATASNFEADVKRIIKQIKSNAPEGLTGCTSYLVVDLSSTCFVDNTGVEALHEALEKCTEAGVQFSLAALPDNVLRTLQKSGTLKLVGHEKVFPTIQDAVLACTSCMERDSENLVASLLDGRTPSQVALDFASMIHHENEELKKSDLDPSLAPEVFNDPTATDPYPVYRQTNFSFRENGRVRTASIISNSSGQIVKSSYL